MAYNISPGRHFRLWFIVVVVGAVCLAIANHQVFPDSFYLLGCMLLITVGVSHWLHGYSDFPDSDLDQHRTWIEWGLAIALFVNLCYHVYYARGISALKQSVTEEIAQTARDQALADQEAKRKIQLNESEAAVIREETERQKQTGKASQAEANRLYQIRIMGGRISPGGRPAVPAVTPVPGGLASVGNNPQASPSPIAGGSDQAAEAPKQKAADRLIAFRSEHLPWLFWFGAFESGMAVIGGAYFMAKLRSDKNGNGLPDWIEKAIAEGRVTVEQLRERFGTRFNLPNNGTSLSASGNRAPFSSPSAGRRRQNQAAGGTSGGASGGTSGRTTPNYPHAGSPGGSKKTASGGSGETASGGSSAEAAGGSQGAVGDGAEPVLATDGEGRQVWSVLGRFWPIILGVRYKGKPKKTVLEIWDTDGAWIGQLGKREVVYFDSFEPKQRIQLIADRIAKMKVLRSEQNF
jgi:hypothetical protein